MSDAIAISTQVENVMSVKAIMARYDANLAAYHAEWAAVAERHAAERRELASRFCDAQNTLLKNVVLTTAMYGDDRHGEGRR